MGRLAVINNARNEPSESRLVAVGEVLVDQLFRLESDLLVYRGVAGGGSAFNIAANAAAAGVATTAIGTGGSDWRAKVAVRDLEALGAICRMSQSEGRLTKTFWQIPRGPIDQPSLTPVSYRTSSRCPICNERLAARQLPRQESLSELAGDLVTSCSAVVTERLTKERMDFVYRARKCGAIAALDLGRTNYLRSRSAAELISLLSCFDIVVVQRAVADSIVRRGGLRDLNQLAMYGPRVALIVSAGAAGMRLYHNDPEGVAEHIPAPKVEEVIDDVGAGDAFLGRLLAAVLRDGSDGEKFHWDLVNLSSSIKEAAEYTREVLVNFGARGHLAYPTREDYPIQQYIGETLESIRSSVAAEESQTCIFCGAKKETLSSHGQATRPRASSSVAETNVRNLYRRVFGAVEQFHAVEQCKSLMTITGTAYVVGSGGSYPVAEFISSVLNSYSKLFARPIHPFDYIKSARATDCVILVSYSGRTPDIEASAVHARRIGVDTVALVTGAAKPKLGPFFSGPNGMVISYGRRYGRKEEREHPGRERGFVSMAGTVAPCAVWTVAALGIEWCSRMSSCWQEMTAIAARAGETLSSTLAADGTLPVFGTGWALPAMLDLESKFVEANLGVVQLHESKDFSHGRFMSFFGKRRGATPAFVLKCGVPDEYEKLLLETLKESGLVIEYSSQFDGMLGGLELLIGSQLIGEKVGRDRGVDISRPKVVPSAGLMLYRYKLEEDKEQAISHSRLWL